MSEISIAELKTYLGNKKPFLALDIGSTKIGVAVTDRSHIIASPLKIIKVKNQQQVINDIVQLCKELEANIIIVGLPLDMDDNEGEQCVLIRNFIKKLYKNNNSLKFYFQDERYSTSIAQDELRSIGMKRKKRDQHDDVVAATIILNDLLDELKKLY